MGHDAFSKRKKMVPEVVGRDVYFALENKSSLSKGITLKSPFK